MKIIVTGSLGHVGRPLTKQLTGQGHTVTVISSSSQRQPEIEALDAVAAIGSVRDTEFLASTFAGAEAVFAMIPPNFAAPDMRAYYQDIGQKYGQAATQAGVRRMVHLSSWGAHLAEGTGVILGSHDVEGVLNAFPDISVTHLRAGSFYTNLYGMIGMIKGQGQIATNYGGADRIVWVHPRDIAAAAAEELQTPSSGKTVRYVASDERTAQETARVLGEAIGQPDLEWITLSDAQVQAGMEQSGMSPQLASLLVDLNASIHSGALGEDYELHRPVLGEVKLEDFAGEFTAAFEQAENIQQGSHP